MNLRRAHDSHVALCLSCQQLLGSAIEQQTRKPCSSFVASRPDGPKEHRRTSYCHCRCHQEAARSAGKSSPCQSYQEDHSPRDAKDHDRERISLHEGGHPLCWPSNVYLFCRNLVLWLWAVNHLHAQCFQHVVTLGVSGFLVSLDMICNAHVTDYGHLHVR